MKKITAALMGLVALEAGAQTKGHFEAYDFGNMILHVYYTNDALGDASYIVEGRDGLVTLEEPLFKDNIIEFNAYLQGLGKPVVGRIADYHLGGTGSEDIVMPEGMPDVVKGEAYSGMMQGFAQMFGDAICDLPTGKAEEVPFGSSRQWAGVSFEFNHGPSTGFPAAGILIGGKAYYMHWAPVRSHTGFLQIGSPAAIDAEIAATESAIASGAELFIGGHGGAVDADSAAFRLDYLRRMKEAVSANATAEAFVEAMKAAYPGLAGEEGLADLAAALYSAK